MPPGSEERCRSGHPHLGWFDTSTHRESDIGRCACRPLSPTLGVAVATMLAATNEHRSSNESLSSSGGVPHHHAGMSMLLDEHEASRLVEATRWVVLGDAETQGSASLGNASFDQAEQKPSSDPLVSTRGDDCNGQLRHILSDEAMAMSRLCIRSVPSRADRSVLFGDQSVIAMPWPSCEIHRVPRIGHHLLSGRCRLVRPPDCGLAEHRREKGEVLPSGRSTLKLVHTISPAGPPSA
jgi:hypothetical protein